MGSSISTPREPSSTDDPPSSGRWIEDDAYDRARFDELRRAAPALGAVVERGGSLLPRFEELVADLFAALFKLNVVWRDEGEVAAPARPHGPLLRTLFADAALEHLRAGVRLDEARSGLAAILLAERVVDWLSSGKGPTRDELLGLFEVEHETQASEERDETIAGAEDLANDPSLEDDARARASELADALRDEEAQRQRQRTAREQRQADAFADRVRREAPRLRLQALEVARDLEQAAEDAESWGRGGGEAGDASPDRARTIELGRRLARSPKLRQIARRLGRMRRDARALRRRLFERRSEEIYAVERGSDLGHLLPVELATRKHPQLRRDWKRRYVEGDLAQYRLRGDDERGRGPLIACVDVSSSMAGEKEVWAKAVALTLLDVARRERRACRALLFSSGKTLRRFDLRSGNLFEGDSAEALDLAEYFPGGGTEFEAPLDAALECLRESRFRRGDIVFVTDGESRLRDDWREHFLAEKRRLDFALHAVLIDVASSAEATLRPIADRLTRVSELESDAAAGLFREI